MSTTTQQPTGATAIRPFHAGFARLPEELRPAACDMFAPAHGAASPGRRELFSELGGYDERYFAFYEDVDLNLRARVAGWSFWLEPAAAVWHRGGAAWGAGFDSH